MQASSFNHCIMKDTKLTKPVMNTEVSNCNLTEESGDEGVYETAQVFRLWYLFRQNF